MDPVIGVNGSVGNDHARDPSRTRVQPGRGRGCGCVPRAVAEGMGAAMRVKICCIQSEAEAAMASAAGASRIGLVSAMPSGPGPIPDDRIATIAGAYPDASVLLTARTDPAAIAAHVIQTGVRAVQIVDSVGAPTLAALRTRLPEVEIFAVVHVRGPADIDDAVGIAAHADHLLLDSGAPDAAVRKLGGTGRVHDWALSRAIVRAVDVPVWLAGGLHPGNVAAAIAAVGPYGVDVCSGLRPAGHLDADRLAGFLAAAG